MTGFTMIFVVEVKDPTGKVMSSHEGPVMGEGDISKVFGEALNKFRREHPDTALMSATEQAGPTIAVRHYFKQ